MMTKANMPLAERFALHVNVDGPIMRPDLGPCAVWTGSTDPNGYGQIRIDGRTIQTHRVAFLLENGRLPSPFGLHRCGNNGCVKARADERGPAHVYEGLKTIRGLAERFAAYVNLNGPLIVPVLGPCQVWEGGADENGYGRIGCGRRSEGKMLATHASWLIAFGVEPTLCLLHRCDNPPCVKVLPDALGPAHLFEGTRADNGADMVAKGRSLRGERSPLAILTEDDIRTIRAWEGPAVEIARRLDIAEQTVCNIRKGRRWGHVV